MLWTKDEQNLLAAAVEKLRAGFGHLPEYHGRIDAVRMAEVLEETANRLFDNYPYFHPQYMGQMLKPPHPVAALAYALSMSINPNNHALDGGKASSAMEKEAIAELARMFGWEKSLGHLCSGGTMANLEALWIAGELAPGKLVVASSQAHYTHGRVCGVLKLPFEAIACDEDARMDVAALERKLKEGKVGTVVVTLGSTATGSIDPLPEIVKLRMKYQFRIHIDAAYGGYYKLAGNLEERGRGAFDMTHEADSIVIDPHKHGLQPYGCGCVLFKDPNVGRFYKHDSPYTYFTSSEMHLGEITLECSRPGSSAVALWATQKMFPLVAGGEFASSLEATRRAALFWRSRILASKKWRLALEPQLDIVVWAPVAATSTQTSEQSKRIFEKAEIQGLYLALARLPKALLQKKWKDLEWDSEEVMCLRACIMKPEHETWLEENWRVLEKIL